jgi:hypothetical protein
MTLVGRHFVVVRSLGRSDVGGNAVRPLEAPTEFELGTRMALISRQLKVPRSQTGLRSLVVEKLQAVLEPTRRAPSISKDATSRQNWTLKKSTLTNMRSVNCQFARWRTLLKFRSSATNSG